MKIEYFHASKFGNGATVAEEFERQTAFEGRKRRGPITSAT